MTKNQAEYKKQLNLLKRRVKRWKRDYGITVKIPELTGSRITKKDISKLTELKLKKVKQDIINNLPKYEPPTENDFYNNNTEDISIYFDDTPANTADELDAYIDAYTDSIFNILSDRKNSDVENVMRNLINDLRNAIGYLAFYNFLLEEDTINTLHNIAYDGITTSPARDGRNPVGENAIFQFATVLNMNRPLTDEQSFTLQEHGAVDFYYDEA